MSMLKLIRPAAVGLSIALMSASIGCAGKKGPPNAPKWVTDPYVQHSRDDYIAAAGKGSSMREAEAYATADVAKQLAREIDHQPINIGEYKARTEHAGFDSSRSIELLQLAEFDESRRMLGFDIADRWTHEPKKGPAAFYAHGVLNRSDLADAYETEMRRNTSFANRMITMADGEPVTMRRFAELRAALAAAEAYRDLRYIRDSVGSARYAGDDSLDPPSRSVDALGAQIADLRNSIAASIESSGGRDIPDLFRSEIRQSLQRVGIPVRTDTSGGHIRILVGWETESIHEQRDDMDLVLYRLNVELVEDVSGFSLASRSWDAKTGGRTRSDADKDAIRLARREMSEEIDEFITDAVFAQSINAR